MAIRYLLDASALYPLALKLRDAILAHSKLFAILDLTVYEIGNVIWKEYRRGSIDNPVYVAKTFNELLSSMAVLRVEPDLSGILDLAISEGITFYDAAYLYTARKHGLKLVTEDSDLLRFPISIDTEQLARELKLHHT